MITIQDEQLERQLQQIADDEHRSVEAVLKMLLAYYPTRNTVRITSLDSAAAVLQTQRNAYAEARRYWRQIGNAERLALTDDELDEQFWLFDEDGIPRLKSDQSVVEGTIQPGSGVWLARIADTMAVVTDNPIDAEQADDILNAEYADYLMKRMQDDLYA